MTFACLKFQHAGILKKKKKKQKKVLAITKFAFERKISFFYFIFLKNKGELARHINRGAMPDVPSVPLSAVCLRLRTAELAWVQLESPVNKKEISMKTPVWILENPVLKKGFRKLSNIVFLFWKKKFISHFEK